MNIFVTGVAGFVGSHLADCLLADGHSVAGCDNLIGGDLDNVSPAVDFHQVDCKDFAKIKELFRGCDIVYHCAATAYEGLSVFSPWFITDNIVTASASVFSAAIANGVTRIVFFSSMARYGHQQTPFVESYPPKPQDPYGIGKFSAELILKNLCEVHGTEYVIVVPHNIIGPRQKYDDPYRNVASIMINLMLQNRQPLIYGDGSQKRCFSYIDDCLYCLKEVAFRDNVVGEVINIGPDEEETSILELAEKIANLLRFNLNPVFLSERPQDVKVATCSSDKARKLLDYKTSTTLDEGLRRMISYVKNRGPRPFKYHIDVEISNSLTPKTWEEKLF